MSNTSKFTVKNQLLFLQDLRYFYERFQEDDSLKNYCQFKGSQDNQKSQGQGIQII